MKGKWARDRERADLKRGNRKIGATRLQRWWTDCDRQETLSLGNPRLSAQALRMAQWLLLRPPSLNGAVEFKVAHSPDQLKTSASLERGVMLPPTEFRSWLAMAGRVLEHYSAQ